jgi:hypothetical protein
MQGNLHCFRPICYPLATVSKDLAARLQNSWSMDFLQQASVGIFGRWRFRCSFIQVLGALATCMYSYSCMILTIVLHIFKGTRWMRCRPCLWPTFYWFHLSRCSFIFYRESSHLYFLCGEIVLLMLNLYLLKLIWLSSRCYYYYIRKLRITFYSFKFYIRWFVHTAL